MVKLQEYIRWVGDLDFRSYPFREADALVLCVASYFDLGPVFRDTPGDVYLKDCLPMIEAGQAKLMITGGDLGNGEIFETAVRSERFGSLRISDYEDQLRHDPPLQFSAVTFHAADFSFIAYRGTDASIAGWREDCMISFTKTEAQDLSLSYAQRVMHGGRWYIAGHSKGANQALFAACMLDDERWSTVERVFLLDGPGFCPEVLDRSLEQRIDPKTTRIIPEYDVVGKLFEPKITDTRIVRSYRTGIMQHSLASWLVEYGSLATAPQNDPKSVALNRLMNGWIESISQEDRPVFIGELFDALSAGGSESLEDLDPDRLEAVLVRLTGVSKTTKRTFAKLPQKLLFDETIPELPKSKTEKLLALLKDLRVQSGLLLLAGTIVFLLSGFLFELTTMSIVTIIAALQLVLTIRRLIRQRGNPDGMRSRFIILIATVALAAILWFKEQAMFLIGSGIYGILFLSFAYYSIESGLKQKEEPFLRVLNFVEGGIAAVYGLGFLVIPQTVVKPFAVSLAANVALDGLLRLGCWIVRRRQKRKQHLK